MDAHGWEVALLKQTVELGCALETGDENDHLVELESVKQVGELAVFLLFGKLHVVLDQAVQGELGVGVDEHLQRLTCREGNEFEQAESGMSAIGHPDFGEDREAKSIF